MASATFFTTCAYTGCSQDWLAGGQVDIKLNNRAKWSQKKGEYDYYDWELYVDEDEAELNKIDHIVYFLHKTFPNPVRTVTDAKNRFSLSSRGWGEFDIGVQVVYKDGHTDHGTYRLDLSKSWSEDDS
jgi:transcription initiation factor IIF auxiliary subunit